MPGPYLYNQYQQPTQPKEPKGPGFWQDVKSQGVMQAYGNWVSTATKPQLMLLGAVSPPLAAYSSILHSVAQQPDYSYKPDDDVTKIAQQFNTTPAAILQANPGAYPFTTGQTIKLPAQQPTAQNQPGAAPFGVNLAGQRLDASGNAWDPSTAKTDIYGGQFIQPGQKKWERINGKLRRVQYEAGGKKTILKGGNKDAAPVGSDPQAVSNAFIRFGVSSG
jgi:LysM repeat protein